MELAAFLRRKRGFESRRGRQDAIACLAYRTSTHFSPHSAPDWLVLWVHMAFRLHLRLHLSENKKSRSMGSRKLMFDQAGTDHSSRSNRLVNIIYY